MRALSRLITTLPRALDADLMHTQQLSLTDYFALTYLSEATEHRLRMGEFADALSLTLSGATRTATRLESQGYVIRERSVCDGRGFDVILTDAGLKRLKRAWPSHLASARERVLDNIDPQDIQRLTALLTDITPDIRDMQSRPESSPRDDARNRNQ